MMLISNSNFTLLQACLIIITTIIYIKLPHHKVNAGDSIGQSRNLSAQNQTRCSTYTHKLTLPSTEAEITLEYLSTNTTLSVRMTSDLQSCLSFGISTPAASMMGSEAVTGTIPNDVQIYTLINEGIVSKDASHQTLLNATFTQDAEGSVLEYTQLLDDGINKPIDGYGKNTFLWAVGFNNNVRLGHKLNGETHGAIILDLSPCKEDEEGDGFIIIERNDKELLALHGKLAVAAFGAIMPFAAVIALVRKLLPLKNPIVKNKEAWFVIHLGLNGFSYFMIVGLFVMSVMAVNQTDGEHFRGSLHSILGLVVFILVTIQVAWAIVRPHTGNKEEPKPSSLKDDDVSQIETNFHDESDSTIRSSQNSEAKNQKSTHRTIWEGLHRLLACIILGLGFFQIHSGLVLYHDIYESANYLPLYWGITGSFIGISFIGVVLARCS